jgi:DNA-binding NarL/FixJ family response regulator
MKDKIIRVVIADDHDIYRDGLKMLLSRDKELEIVAEAASGKQLVSLAAEFKPDVILTDLRMPNMDGIEAIRAIRQTDKVVRCIALSTFDSEQLIIDALEAGATGYVIKNAQKGEIIEAVKTVVLDVPYYCRSTSSRLVRLISKSNFNPYGSDRPEHFSDKEKQIIRLICEDKASQEIADILCLSRRTVEGYRTRILEKMNVKTPAGVAIYAIKNGIYSTQ